MESCDGHGGAALLLEHRLFPVYGPRLCRPRLELQLSVGALDGFVRHLRCDEDTVRLASLFPQVKANEKEIAPHLRCRFRGRCCRGEVHVHGLRSGPSGRHVESDSSLVWVIFW